jgi:hypothetical protein
MASIQLYVTDDGRVIDQATAISEELTRAGASENTLTQQIVSDYAYDPAPIRDPDRGAIQRSAFIDQYIRDTAQNPAGPIRYGPGYSTVDAQGRYTFGIFAETAEQIVQRNQAALNTSASTALVAPAIALPPTSIAASVGLTPTVGAGNRLAAPSLPYFVGGELGSVRLRSDTDPGWGNLGNLELGKVMLQPAGLDLPRVQLANDEAEYI